MERRIAASLFLTLLATSLVSTSPCDSNEGEIQSSGFMTEFHPALLVDRDGVLLESTSNATRRRRNRIQRERIRRCARFATSKRPRRARLRRADIVRFRRRRLRRLSIATRRRGRRSGRAARDRFILFEWDCEFEPVLPPSHA